MNVNAAALKSAMEFWNKCEAMVRAAFPNATDEEIYQLVAAEMNKRLLAA